MSNSMRKKKFIHPTLPFITVSWSDETDHSSAGWTYTIEGLYSSSTSFTAADAREAAEYELFSQNGEFVEQKLKSAVDRGDFELALSIAHHRGYWDGVANHKARIKKSLKRAITNLEPLLR
ncbi:hypothetical protein M2262_003223 [Pseudomonas sp. BIGb0408]|uniref:Uncharacterized protein n=1 Tax=Phytopseudomonas flavescens TaxID=29435 RepID=A0A7Y9XL28_9GAMM|nr:MULTISPECIES: hypothetical protein [Pseudomonas]MCW2293173.1 hypothetical protein [Pseudomonas sp. BIGb0408]NYH72256.1 hypothetical protein [Pseudomonas flavescens]